MVFGASFCAQHTITVHKTQLLCTTPCWRHVIDAAQCICALCTVARPDPPVQSATPAHIGQGAEVGQRGAKGIIKSQTTSVLFKIKAGAFPSYFGGKGYLMPSVKRYFDGDQETGALFVLASLEGVCSRPSHGLGSSCDGAPGLEMLLLVLLVVLAGLERVCSRPGHGLGRA